MPDLITLSTIKQKLKDDLDINDENFVADTTTNPELLGYINEAIDDAESIIHNLYEDYFLSRASIAITSGTKEYSLPSNIFAHKIRALIYDDGASRRYEIKQIKRLIQTIYADDNTSDPDAYLRYRLVNDGVSPGDARIRFYPTPNLTSTTNLTCWFIRNANRMSSDTDVLDIPDFVNYVYAHVKWNISRKEQLPNMLSIASGHLHEQRSLMETTLTDMIPDENNFVVKDLTFYSDFDDPYGGYHNW